MNKVRKAVIPVAGMGTRFLPATKAIPKAMLSIIDKPTIQYIVEEAVAAGIEEILFITSAYNKSIEDHFDKSYELESRLEKSGKTELLEIAQNASNMVKAYFVRQGEPMGSGHAISLAKNFVGDDHFVVMYGDDMYTTKSDVPVLKQLINLHEETGGNVIGGVDVPDEVVFKYGIVEFESEKTNKIKSIVEKPNVGEAPSNFAGLGRYLVSPRIFELLENISIGAGGEYQFTDGMEALMKEQDFYACTIDGKYYDMGNKVESVKAVIDLALSRDDLKDEIKKHISNIK